MGSKKGLPRKPLPQLPHYIKDPGEKVAMREALATGPQLPHLRARLNKEGNYLVCGRINCGARFAEVGEDLIRFLPGWAPRRDKVWELSTHAKNKIRRRMFEGRELRPKLRRYPKNGGVRSGNDVMDDLNPMVNLPVVVVCPTCGFLNSVRSEEVSGPMVSTLATLSPPSSK